MLRGILLGCLDAELEPVGKLLGLRDGVMLVFLDGTALRDGILLGLRVGVLTEFVISINDNISIKIEQAINIVRNNLI